MVIKILTRLEIRVDGLSENHNKETENIKNRSGGAKMVA